MAARFRVVGTTNDWSDTTGWSLTSGGAGGQTVPSAADDVTLDGNSGSACVLDTSARVAKTLTINGFTGTITFDQQLSVSGSITFTTTGFTFAGATTNKLRMIAAGTWTTNGKTIPQDVEIGGTTTFTSTLGSNLTITGNLTLTNTTSTTLASSTFVLTAPSCTISGTQTINITGSDIAITGTTTISDSCLLTHAGATRWGTFGLTTTGSWNGTGDSSTVVFNGTGTWTGAAAAYAGLLVIDTAGTLTISGNVLFNGGTLTYTTGTMVVTSSTLTLGGASTLNTTGMTWNAVTISAAITVTLTSVMRSTTLTMPNTAMTWAGSFGWTVGTFTNTTITATRIWTFTAGNTYTVLSAMTTVHAAAQTVRFSFVSSSPGTRYSFILGPGATQDNGFIDVTDADSRLGQIVFSYHGVLSNTLNWATSFLVNAGRVRSSYQMVA